MALNDLGYIEIDDICKLSTERILSYYRVNAHSWRREHLEPEDDIDIESIEDYWG